MGFLSVCSLAILPLPLTLFAFWAFEMSISPLLLAFLSNWFLDIFPWLFLWHGDQHTQNTFLNSPRQIISPAAESITVNDADVQPDFQVWTVLVILCVFPLLFRFMSSGKWLPWHKKSLECLVKSSICGRSRLGIWIQFARYESVTDALSFP